MTSLFFTEYEGNVDLHNRMRANPWQSPFVGASPMDYLERTHLPMERGAISTGGSQGEASTPNRFDNPSTMRGNGYKEFSDPMQVDYPMMIAMYGGAALVLYYLFKKA